MRAIRENSAPALGLGLGCAAGLTCGVAWAFYAVGMCEDTGSPGSAEGCSRVLDGAGPLVAVGLGPAIVLLLALFVGRRPGWIAFGAVEATALGTLAWVLLTI